MAHSLDAALAEVRRLKMLQDTEAAELQRRTTETRKTEEQLEEMQQRRADLDSRRLEAVARLAELTSRAEQAGETLRENEKLSTNTNASLRDAEIALQQKMEALSAARTTVEQVRTSLREHEKTCQTQRQELEGLNEAIAGEDTRRLVKEAALQELDMEILVSSFLWRDAAHANDCQARLTDFANAQAAIDAQPRIDTQAATETQAMDTAHATTGSQTLVASPGDSLSPMFTTIIFNDGCYQEFFCGVEGCGSNASFAKVWFSGLKGFRAHLLVTHDIRVSHETIWPHLTSRVISPKDLALLSQVSSSEDVTRILGPDQCKLDTKIAVIPFHEGLHEKKRRYSQVLKERRGLASQFSARRSSDPSSGDRMIKKPRLSDVSAGQDEENIAPDEDTIRVHHPSNAA